MSRQDFEREVALRARADPAFKAALLADARTTLQQVYGVEMLPDVDLQVLEETPTKLYLVLPFESEELTDEELAGVAGGFGEPMASSRLQITAAAGVAEFVKR
jgi:hypothetical protein